MKKLIALLTILVAAYSYSFASVDTVSIYSNSMFKNVKCVVVTPVNYRKSAPAFPVVYLLHGYGGNYSNWITRAPEFTATGQRRPVADRLP